MDWKRIEPTIISKVGWRTVVSKTFVVPDGRVGDFQTYDKEGAEYVVCIALTKDNKAIIASQYRPGPQKVMEELPGGFLDEGEDPETACRRELTEETGYAAGKMTYLGMIHKDAYNNAKWHCFLATDCMPHKSGQQTEDTEFINVKLISIDQLLKNGREGKITDTEALFLAYEQLLKLRG